MKLRPLFDKVVLEPVEANEKTQGGILLPGTAQEKQQIGVIVAVGNGGVVDGKDVVMQVEVGQKVLYAKYSGSEFKYEGKTFTISFDKKSTYGCDIQVSGNGK